MAFRRMVTRLAIIYGLLFCLSFSSPVISAKQTLSKHSYQVLETTQTWIEAGESSRAIERLKELVLETTGRAYEQAIVLQSLAHAFIAVENYPAAIQNLQQSLALGALPDGAAQSIRYNLAQLYMATEGFKEAAQIMEQWLSANTAPPAEAYVLLGSAYLQLKQYKRATGPLRKAIEMSKAPKESWYQNLLAAYSELKAYKKCTGLLRTMLQRFPSRPVYWSQLAGFEMMLQRHKQALAVMELAYLQGYLKSERDLLNLAQLYMMREAAYKAGALLEKEIKAGRIKTTRKNWELLANAWQQARELVGTIAALEEAVRLESGGKLNLRLAQLYMEVKRWNDAERIIQQVIDRKNNNDELHARAWLLLGIAHYENGRIETSASAFQSAKVFPHVRKDADQWLAYLDQH